MNLDEYRKVKEAERTGWLHLSNRLCVTIPSRVFELGELRRLDLSFNCLRALPPQICQLTKLEQLFLSRNPLTVIPPEIAGCQSLVVRVNDLHAMAPARECLDLRFTRVAELPTELGRLQHLRELLLENSPVGASTPSTTNPKKLLKALLTRDHRLQLERDIIDALLTGLYEQQADLPQVVEATKSLVQEVSALLETNEEMKLVLRNATRIFPTSPICDDTETEAAEVFQRYTDIRRDNERKKLQADLEIKIRAIYYDKVDPTLVEGMIADIYAHIPLLEDVQFLISYATTIFPDSSALATGSVVASNMIALQDDLTRQRQDAIQGLVRAMQTLYPEQESETVSDVGRKFAGMIKKERFATKKELVALRKAAADATSIFPADFVEINLRRSLKALSKA